MPRLCPHRFPRQIPRDRAPVGWAPPIISCRIKRLNKECDRNSRKGLPFLSSLLMIEIPGPAPSPLRAPEVRHVDRTGTFSHALQRSAMSTVFLARDRNPLSRQHHTPRPIVPCSRTQHCLGVTPSPSTDKLLQYPRGALYYPQRSEPVFSDNRVIHNLVETKTNIVSLVCGHS